MTFYTNLEQKPQILIPVVSDNFRIAQLTEYETSQIKMCVSDSNVFSITIYNTIYFKWRVSLVKPQRVRKF
jgi:hypothetical protein